MVFLLNSANKIKFDEIQIGDKSSFSIKITEEIINQFSLISGDHNPLHTDENYAKKTKFKQRICHGMLLASYFSQLTGMYLPGEKCLYLSQNLNFLNPCFIHDTILIEGIIIRKSESTKILEIKTTIFNENNLTLVSGSAKVIFLESD